MHRLCKKSSDTLKASSLCGAHARILVSPQTAVTHYTRSKWLQSEYLDRITYPFETHSYANVYITMPSSVLFAVGR